MQEQTENAQAQSTTEPTGRTLADAITAAWNLARDIERTETNPKAKRMLPGIISRLSEARVLTLDAYGLGLDAE